MTVDDRESLGAAPPDEGHEAEIEAIAAVARAQRPPTPRWLWILSGLVGIACAIAFGIALLVGGEASPSTGPAPARRGGPGFGIGLALGIAAGTALGFGIARQLRGHSPRKIP